MTTRTKIIVSLLAASGAYLLFLVVLNIGTTSFDVRAGTVILGTLFLGVLSIILFDGVLRKDRYEIQRTAPEFIELSTLSSVFEDIEHGILGVDKNRIIVSMNAAARKLFSVDETSLVGHPFGAHLEIRSSVNRAPSIAFVDDAFRSGKSITADEELYVVSRTGREIPVAITATPIYREKKNPHGVIVAFHDLSVGAQTRISKKVDKKGKTRG